MDWKKKIAAVVFLLSLVCVPVAAFLLPDQAVSKTERRKLAKKPSFTVAAFGDGTYMEWYRFRQKVWSSWKRIFPSSFRCGTDCAQ